MPLPLGTFWTATVLTAVCFAWVSSAQTPRPTDIGLDGLDAEHAGRRLVTETYALIGPEVADPAMRYAGNNLSCQNCHMDAGTRAHGLSLVGVYEKYPRAIAATGGSESIEDRINGCMTRSMNGRALPEDGREMRAFVAYLRLLAADAGAYGDPEELPAPLPALGRAPDLARGKTLYEAECAACHRSDGLGMLNGHPGEALGYLHPPLWGPDSFNAAAGMAELKTAAAFIHANMPLGTEPGAPVLLPADAWDIAAYVEARSRPAGPAD